MKELIEEKKFEMRAYDKVELALLRAGSRRCLSGWLCCYHKAGSKITKKNEPCTCIRRSKSKSCKNG